MLIGTPKRPEHVIIQGVSYEEYFPPWADGIATIIRAATAIRESEISFFIILLFILSSATYF